jgi:Ca-activated chloride channel family protein
MLTHGHTWSALLALSAITYLFIGSAAAEDKDEASGVPTYRSTVSEVRVTFFATDENNHPLETMTKSDFAIVDNERVVRNFRSFTHSQETSLDVVVLVDLSESVAPRVRGAISDVLRLVAREQSIAEDNISVLSFGGTFGTPGGLRPAILCSNGCRASDSASRLLAVKSGGVTPLFDALMFAADFISDHRRAGRSDVRPVLLLFSDGCDTITLHSASQALQAAQEAGALVYSVDMGRTENPSAGSTFLRRVSEATGGRYFPLALRNSTQEGAAAVLTAVLEDLRAS